MTINSIINLCSDAGELLLETFSSSSDSFEPLARQVTDTVLSVPDFVSSYWEAIATPFKFASSCYQLAMGGYNGVRACQEISTLNAEARLPQTPIESERTRRTLQDRKLVIISSLSALLHIPNLLSEKPGSNPWTSLHGLITRSISIIRNSNPAPSNAPLSPLRLRFQLVTDAICTLAATVSLGIQTGYIPNEDPFAKYIICAGTVCSSAQFVLTVHNQLLLLPNHIATITNQAILIDLALNN